MRAKKSLGQNFLTSKSAVEKIIETAKVGSEDIVLEIGPGKGILTEELLKKAKQVIAVEKDDNLYKFLKEKFKDKKLNLIHGDILEIKLPEIKKYKLVANIPYNITGKIIKKFLTASIQPNLIVLLVQYEVAKRIVAEDKKESILSISVKAYGKPKYIKKVKAGSFSPMPKVDSAILLIENISRDFFKNIDEEKFFKMVKAGFSQKRKKLSNTLKSILGEDLKKVFKKARISPDLRAENLTIFDWQKFFLDRNS